MSDILRFLNRHREQETRQIERGLARLTRAVRDSSQYSAPQIDMPRPQVPAGIQPVFVINMPVRSLR